MWWDEREFRFVIAHGAGCAAVCEGVRGDIRRVGNQDIPFLRPIISETIEPFFVKNICLLKRYVRRCCGGRVESPETDIVG